MRRLRGRVDQGLGGTEWTTFSCPAAALNSSGAFTPALAKLPTKELSSEAMKDLIRGTDSRATASIAFLLPSTLVPALDSAHDTFARPLGAKADALALASAATTPRTCG